MNLANIFNTFRIVVLYRSHIEEAVKTVESLFPGGSRGAEKLEALRLGLKDAFEIEEAVSNAFETVWPTIQKVVAYIVAKFNKDGTFTKTQ